MLNKIKKLWGAFRNLSTYLSFYLTAGTFVFSMVTAYATTLAPWLREQGLNIPFWMFFLVVSLGGIGLLLFEHFVTMPGYFGYWNKNWYEHDNPMRADIEKIAKRQQKIMDKLGLKDD